MNRPMAFAVLIAGFLITAGSFIAYAGNALPYPDPTAELLAHQAAEAKKWGLLFVTGLLTSALGAFLLWRRSSER
ncbi:MAG: hypothetical protein ACLFSC_08595 [Wenzhouxiangella sp.]